jgi:hypothetical protein
VGGRVVVAGAVFNDVLDGLWVDVASREICSLAWVERGWVRADEGVACDEANEGGGVLSLLTRR